MSRAAYPEGDDYDKRKKTAAGFPPNLVDGGLHLVVRSGTDGRGRGHAGRKR
jgi:hypothetical protein